ncbi:MAG: hypothetical protein VYE77_01840 [Planctomycetota bacterium]|nr:hypothetical protein [Planctomycetota bacterium]
MLREIKRALEPGGRFVLTTPNLGGSRAILEAIAGPPPQEVSKYHRSLDYGIVHAEEYLSAELTDLFRSLGFGDVVVKSHYYRKPRLVERVQTLGLRLIRPLSRMFHADALRVLPGDNLVVGASKGGPVVDEWPRSIFQEPN